MVEMKGVNKVAEMVAVKADWTVVLTVGAMVDKTAVNSELKKVVS